MWVVELLKVPERNDFRDGFFPRKVYYKKDAIALQDEVAQKGGEAIIKKAYIGTVLPPRRSR
jgi:hypothetical protein